MAEENRNKTQRNLSNVLDISGAAALGFSEKTFQALNNDAVNALNYGNIIEATKILNRIIEIDEKSIEAYEYLCHIACGRREWKLALEYQKKIQQNEKAQTRRQF